MFGCHVIPLSAFLDSATVWNPKWVVRSEPEGASPCCSAILAEEKHRWGDRERAPLSIRLVDDKPASRRGTAVENDMVCGVRRTVKVKECVVSCSGSAESGMSRVWIFPVCGRSTTSCYQILDSEGICFWPLSFVFLLFT